MKKKLLYAAGAMLAGIILCSSFKPVETQAKAISGFSAYLEKYYEKIEYAKAEGKETGCEISLLAEEAKIPENVAIANVNDKLNIRKGPGTNYDIVGHLSKNSYVCILSYNSDGWVEIKSGEVTGYVKEDYLYTGTEGAEMAAALAVLKAKVTASSINLRSEPSTESNDNIICVLSAGDELDVLDEIVLNKDDEGAALWVKVSYKGKEGYLAKQYVDCNYTWTAATKVVTPTPTPVQEQKKDNKKDEEIPKVSYENVSELRKNIIATAEAHLGLKYVWGGTNLSSGCDCSGFCLAVYRACGIDTSRFNRCSYDIAVSPVGRKISRSELQPGDFVFYARYGKIYHIAMYYGDGMIIHESSREGKAVISKMDYTTPYKYMNFLGD